MKHKQTDAALRTTVLKAASRWLVEKQSPFAVAEEFAMYVTQSSMDLPPPEGLLLSIFACGFPCVRGDKGERVLWLRPAESASSACLQFLPTEAVRQFSAALATAEAEAA